MAKRRTPKTIAVHTQGAATRRNIPAAEHDPAMAEGRPHVAQAVNLESLITNPVSPANPAMLFVIGARVPDLLVSSGRFRRKRSPWRPYPSGAGPSRPRPRVDIAGGPTRAAPD